MSTPPPPPPVDPARGLGIVLLVLGVLTLSGVVYLLVSTLRRAPRGAPLGDYKAAAPGARIPRMVLTPISGPVRR